MTIAATTSVVIARSLALARVHITLSSPPGKIYDEKIRMEIASNSGCSWEGMRGEGVREREEKFSSNLPSVGHEHILHAHIYYHWKRTRGGVCCLLVRFSYDDVQDSSSLSLCRYITQRERKRQALF